MYQNQIYFNNFNISTSAPSYIPKKAKYPNDPLNVLRDQTNSMIKTSNGKAVPFEEPHNRINLENVIKLNFKIILLTNSSLLNSKLNLNYFFRFLEEKIKEQL